MGYRSDVKMIVSIDHNVITPDEILSHLGEDAQKEFKNDLVIEKDDKYSYIEFNAESIKWYDDPEWYPEIVQFEQWIDYIKDLINNGKEDILGLHFMRIGEDLSDCEEIYEGNVMKWICLHRYMTVEE